MKYTYHSLIFQLCIKYGIKIYLLPTLVIEKDSDMEDWGITDVNIRLSFLAFNIRYNYIIDRHNFYDLKDKSKFRIFGNIV